jgi:hypothetical protein
VHMDRDGSRTTDRGGGGRGGGSTDDRLRYDHRPSRRR